MGKSGNPAKAAQRGTEAQVRAAVRQGKGFLVKPFPHTEVTVKSTDPEEAVEVIKALQPAPTEVTDEQLESMFYEAEGLFLLLGNKAEYNDMIGAWLKRVQENYEFNAVHG